MISDQVGPYRTFGVCGDSLNLMSDAWKSMEHVFTSRDPTILTNCTRTHGSHIIPGPRYPLHLLETHPVDLLVIECGSWQCPSPPRQGHRWECLVASTPVPKRPLTILEVWPPNSLLWEQGPTGKASRVRWKELGYTTHMKMIDSQCCGGAVVQPRAIVVRDTTKAWRWAPYNLMTTGRPMQNLLIPKGLRPKRKMRDPPADVSLLPKYNEAPLPGRPCSWILDGDGPRQLFLEETAKGLGLDKTWNVPPGLLTAKLLSNSSSLFHWEYISQCFLLQMSEPVTIPPVSISLPSSTVLSVPDDTEYPEWRPADMSVGSPWYQARITRLRQACSTYPNSDKLYEDGLQMLARHRANYDDIGPAPKCLQLLWWEFPQSQWDEIRDGGSMNFLKEPKHQIKPNAPMSDEELAVAGEFVDELIALGVLREPTDDSGMPMDIVTNAPLFTVPKPGQPGQYRCIADMLKGGQNDVVGNDPVILPRAPHILDEMYHGGYSSVFDFSKYFYNFPTRQEDRPYLGLLHPVTEQILAYYGLPMGAGNSPGIGCRNGEAFLRLVRESHHIFQGDPSINCWWTGFQRDGGYDPRKGYGYNLTNVHGLVVKLWGFVDDFMNHAPTKKLIHEAKLLFMDIACILGFLCHPSKCPPPSQIVKFIGFEFDSVCFPILRIPLEKRERGLAIVEYLLAMPVHQQISRLSLAVATGLLQSFTDATPGYIGATYLREHYNLLHPGDMGHGLAPYCTKTILTPRVRAELKWWASFLRSHRGRPSRMMKSATLVPTWGDGSGTGTGGSLGLPDKPLKMWLGEWSPIVYSFSSNWKELQTLRLSLLHVQSEAAQSVLGTTVFYFTDNMVTYWIAQAGSSTKPRLHDLIYHIKCLELELGIILQVVHVPGVVMIQQGSDALSRGVWVTPFQAGMDQRTLTASVFAPLPADLGFATHYLRQHNLHVHFRFQDWNTQWVASDLLDTFSVWFPPPEIARQAISFMLAAYVQRPLTTSALFFVPRVVPAFWFGLSRHIIELPLVHPREHSLAVQPVLPIPIVVLYLAPHVRMLPDPKSRMDRPSNPSGLKWHRTQAEILRGLPPSNIDVKASPDMLIRPPGFSPS